MSGNRSMRHGRISLGSGLTGLETAKGTAVIVEPSSQELGSAYTADGPGPRRVTGVKS